MKPKNFQRRFEFVMGFEEYRKLEELAAYYHQSQGAILREAICSLYVMMAIQKDRMIPFEPNRLKIQK